MRVLSVFCQCWSSHVKNEGTPKEFKLQFGLNQKLEWPDISSWGQDFFRDYILHVLYMVTRTYCTWLHVHIVHVHG